MNSSVMDVLEFTPEEFRHAWRRLIQKHPGGEIRIVDGDKVISRLILPSGPKPEGWPDGAHLIGEGPTLSDFVIEQRD